MLVGNRLLAGFSAVAQTRQLSHTACSLSFAYFNARIFTTYDNQNSCAQRTSQVAFPGRLCTLPGGGLAEGDFCAAGRQFFLRYRAITTSI
jgi:hypothetical protein